MVIWLSSLGQNIPKLGRFVSQCRPLFILCNILCVNHLDLDDFLDATDDTVHRLYPVLLGTPFQVFSQAFDLRHLADDAPVAVLCLLVEVCQIAVEPARQDHVIGQERVVFFQIRPIHPPPTSDLLLKVYSITFWWDRAYFFDYECMLWTCCGVKSSLLSAIFRMLIVYYLFSIKKALSWYAYRSFNQ